MAFSPVVAGIAAVWLLVDFLSLPRDSGIMTALETKSAARARAHGNAWTEDAWIVRRDGEVRLSFDYDENEPAFVGSAMSFPRLWSHGWWAPTSESYNATLHTYFEQPPTPTELQQVREMFAAHLEASGDEYLTQYARSMRQGLGRVSYPVPFGYSRNFIAGTCVLIIVLHLGRWSYVAALRARDHRRINRGLCPKCAYDLRGRPVSAACPECGAAHEVNQRPHS